MGNIGSSHLSPVYWLYRDQWNVVDKELAGHLSLLKSLNITPKDGRTLFEAYEKLVYATDSEHSSDVPKLKKSKSARLREMIAERRKKWKRKKNTKKKLDDSYEKRLEKHKIDSKKFANLLGLGHSELALRCFKLMADDGGHLTFPRFATHSWNWCTYDKVGLSHAAFVLYDSHSKGKLSEEDVLKVLSKTHDLDNNYNPIASVDVRNNKDYRVAHAVKGIRSIASTLPGEPVYLKEEEWHSYVKHHPLVLFPCFKVQEACREKICGEKFWARQTKRRYKMQIKTGQIIDADFVESMIEKLGREQGLQKGFHKVKRKRESDAGRKKKRVVVPGASDDIARKESCVDVKTTDICCVCKLRILGYCSECITAMKRSNAIGDKNKNHKRERMLGAGNECCMSVVGKCGHLAHSSCMEAWLIECATSSGSAEDVDCPECFLPWTCVARERKAGEKATAQIKNKVIKSISGVAKGKGDNGKKKKNKHKFKGYPGEHPFLK